MHTDVVDQLSRLIRVLAGRTCFFVCFVAHLLIDESHYVNKPMQFTASFTAVKIDHCLNENHYIFSYFLLTP